MSELKLRQPGIKTHRSGNKINLKNNLSYLHFHFAGSYLDIMTISSLYSTSMSFEFPSEGSVLSSS